MNETSKSMILIETLDASHLIEGTLDRQTRSVQQVIIQSGWSKNKRCYSADVLRRSVPLFNGVKCFEDHPTPQEIREGVSRSKRNVSGWLDGVMYSEERQALIGTRHFTSNEAGNDSLALVSDILEGNAPADLIGGSINAFGPAKPGAVGSETGIVVEDIKLVHSVDDVAYPAAGGKFERLVANGDELMNAILESLSLEDLIAARPDLVDSLKGQMKRVRQDDAVRAVSEERDQVQATLVETQTENTQLKDQAERYRIEAEQARADSARATLSVTLEKALREARLRPVWENELRQQLSETAPDHWPDKIARARKLARDAEIKSVVPVEGSPRLTENAPLPTPNTVDDLLPREGEDSITWNRRIDARSGKG